MKKETLAQVFSCEFCENFKNTFLQNDTGDCFWQYVIIFHVDFLFCCWDHDYEASGSKGENWTVMLKTNLSIAFV